MQRNGCNHSFPPVFSEQRERDGAAGPAGDVSMGERPAREHAYLGKYVPSWPVYRHSLFPCVGGQGDLLLANHQTLGLSEHPDWHLVVLLAYADGLFEDQQHRRALVRSMRERRRRLYKREIVTEERKKAVGEEREQEQRERESTTEPYLTSLFAVYTLFLCFFRLSLPSPPLPLPPPPSSLLPLCDQHYYKESAKVLAQAQHIGGGKAVDKVVHRTNCK